MPKFSESEKEIIRQRLKTEGEKLFAKLGLKKVTIEDLIHAVGIAKASFYVFYPGKEHLYMDIMQGNQQKIFADVEGLLERNTGLSNAERVKQVFACLYQGMVQYPILLQLDTATVEYLSRKLPKQILQAYSQSNLNAAQVLCSHGVEFNCSIEIASKAFQSIYCCWLALKDDDENIQNAVINIILDGVISQVVKN